MSDLIIPSYSNCCSEPVLGDGLRRRLYCCGCGATIRSFAGQRRVRALERIEFVRSHCRVDVMLFGRSIAYARDVPNLEFVNGAYRKVGRSTYKYFLQGCSLVTALGWQQCQTQDGFRRLADAEAAMRAVLK